MLLQMPVLGSILRRASIARFTRTLGTMISSGVPILTALDGPVHEYRRWYAQFYSERA